MLEPVSTNPWVRAVGVVLALALVATLTYLLSPVLVPLFFAFLVAYVLDPVVDAFEKRKISRGASIAALILVGLILVLMVPLFLVPALITEADGLIDSAVAGAADRGGMTGLFHRVMGRLPLQSLVEVLGWEAKGLPEYDPQVPPPETGTGVDFTASDPLTALIVGFAELVRGPAVQFMKNNALQIASAGKAAGGGLAHFFSSIGSWFMGLLLLVGNIALFAVVAVYLLKDFDAIIETARELIPPRYRDSVVRIMTKINGQIRSFLRGQLVVCACLGLMYSVGLFASGVPFAFLIGAFGAVASFIPYMGIVLTFVPAVVLCVVQQQGIDAHLVGVLATFGIAQLLEGTVLTPKIVGEQVGLGAVWVILAVLVFGNALGFLGLLLAVPIAASLKVLVVEALAYYRASPIFEAASPDE